MLQSKVFAAAQSYRPYPNFGDVLFRSNFGHSTYHSGTIKLEKRYSSGITFITFYTSFEGHYAGSGVAPIQNHGLEKARAGHGRNHRRSPVRGAPTSPAIRPSATGGATSGPTASTPTTQMR